MTSEDLIKYYGTDDIEVSSAELFTFNLNEDGITASVVLASTIDKSTLTQIVIPYECQIDGNSYIVTNIVKEAFRECKYLIKVIIPSSIEFIGERVFFRCTNLADISIPNSVTSIGEWAFGYCENLIEINIPNSITNISESLFQACSKLKEVVISNGVVSIDKFAFRNCYNLIGITIPNSILSIGAHAFYECSYLDIVHYTGSEEEWNEIEIGSGNEWLINSVIYYYKGQCGDNVYSEFDGTNTLIISGTGDMWDYGYDIGAMPWEPYRTHIVNLIIKNDVAGICDNAFSNCDNLTNVTIPNSVVSIGKYAFYNCSSLTKLIIPNSVVEIGAEAFSNCTHLTDIKLSNNLTELEAGLFWQCRSLKKMRIPNGIKTIGSCVFENCYELESVIISNSVEVIGAECFNNCRILTKVVIEGENLEIGNNVFPVENDNFKIYINPLGNFKENQELQNYFLFWDKYNGLYYYYNEDISQVVFYDESTMSSSLMLFESGIQFDGKEKVVDSDAFMECSQLKTLEINTDIKLKSNTFTDCSNLTEVFINTVSLEVEENVFPVDNSGFTIFANSRSSIIQNEELQPYIYVLKEKKASYNDNLFIAGVGEVELFSNNEIVLTSKTLIDTSVNLTVNLEDIQANGGAKLYGKYASQAGMTLKLTEAMFRMEFLAANIGSEIEIGGSAITTEMSIVENGKVAIDGIPLPLYIGSDKTMVWISVYGENKGSLVFSNEKIQKGSGANYGKTVINEVGFSDGTQVCVKYIAEYMAGQTLKISANYLPDEMTAVLTAPLFAGDQNSLENAMKVGVLTITIPRLMLMGNSDISMNMTGHSQMNIEGQALAVEESECDEGGYYATISKVLKNSSWTSNLAGIAIDNANHLKNGDILQVYGVFYGIGTRPLTREQYFVLPSDCVDNNGTVVYSSTNDLLFTVILKDDGSKITHGIIEAD